MGRGIEAPSMILSMEAGSLKTRGGEPFPWMNEG